MIAVILAQLAARWGQAATLYLLSIAATVAAVSVPAYAVAVDHAAVERELAEADAGSLVVILPPLSATAPSPTTELPSHAEELPAYADARSRLKSFVPVTTTQIQVQGLERGNRAALEYNLMARDGLCRHVTFLEGRCPVGNREAALPSSLAKKTRLGAGDTVVLTPVRSSEDGGWEPDGPPVSLTLVGVFRANDPGSAYWTLEDPLGAVGDPAIVTNRRTLETLLHQRETIYLDAILPERLLTPERIPQLRRELQTAERRLSQQNPSGISLLTRLPEMLDRIEEQGRHARALLPIAAAPLLALCWLVIHLAVGHGVWSRRQELGIVAVRGAKWPTRALLVSGESLVPLLAGVPTGLVLTGLLVSVAAPGKSGVIAIDTEQLLAAGVAGVGTLAAALIAMRRELSTPVARLLRQVPPRSRRLTLAAVEGLTVALGLAVVIELRAFDGELVGIMVAGPAVVILAAATLVSLGAKPLLNVAGRWSLRRGKVAPAVAALYLARRPGSVRLLVVLALVSGTLGYAAAATDVASQGRLAEAEQLLGAPRAVEVRQADRGQLLHAVRAADPEGKYAMAVVSAPTTGDEPPVVAVDSTRFARIVQWSSRYGTMSPARVAEALRMPGKASLGAREPVVVRDGELTAELIPDSLTPDGVLEVSLQLVSLTTGEQVIASFGSLTAEQTTYQTEVSGCADQCRLAAITLSMSGAQTERLGVTFQSLQQGGEVVMSTQEFADEKRWRIPEEGPIIDQLHMSGGDDGLLVWQPYARANVDYVLQAVDVPYPVPAVIAGRLPSKEIVNIDGDRVQFTQAAKLDGLPGVGAVGALIDLEYAERLTREPGAAVSPRVWLAADTPDSVITRLREEGLGLTSDTTIESLRAETERTGAAMALHFYDLAAVLTVLVGLGALALVIAVDRRIWTRGMRSLHIQGAAERTTAAASVWSYGGIVVTSALIGLVAALGAWFASGLRLPFGVEESLLPAWPRWPQMVAGVAVAVLLLFVGALAGGWWQRRLVRVRREGDG